MVRRRAFVGGGLGAALVLWSGRVRADDPVPVVGRLFSGSQADALTSERIMATALRQAGVVPGKDVMIEEWIADGHYDRLPELAADLLRRKPAVILASASPSVIAAKAATNDIPIVFSTGLDPIKAGLVSNFNRPERNVTGAYLPFIATEAKRMQILHELLPQARSVGVLVNPSNADAEDVKAILRAAAPAMGLDLRFAETKTEGDLVPAFEGFARDRADAVFETTDQLLDGSWTDRIVALAEAHHLPVVGVERVRVATGLLASYGADPDEAYAQQGTYAARILKGAKPGDLPVVQIAKFVLAINMKTAKALGITIPPTLLARADEVIE